MPERIKLDTNASEIKVEDGFIADALIHIRFSEGEFPAQRFNFIVLMN